MGRLFIVGLLMGMADLIPGISSGTIAYLSGIYDRLLNEIKSLSIKNIEWKFFGPLGLGMILSLFIFAHVFSYLMQRALVPLYAFFFGIILASTASCLKEEKLSGFIPWLSFLLGALFCFSLSGHLQNLWSVTTPFTIFLAGIIAAVAMLLPGISGCYVLHLLGVYPVAIRALTNPFSSESIALLAPLAVGLAAGMAMSCRLISHLLTHYRKWVAPFFIGCMAGGLRALYIFSSWMSPQVILFATLGVMLFIIIKLISRKAIV
jgi:putative membrane protein